MLHKAGVMDSDTTASGAPLNPVLGRNLTHGMLDTLGKAIVVGRYETRPFPTEAEIAKTFGVSRSVTREAVKMLTAKGLVSARPRQGTVVQPSSQWNLFDADVLRWLLDRKFSVHLLRQFNQLRIAIEPEAAALAALHHSAEELAAIREGLHRMERADAGDGDPLEADIAFHVAVLRASGNPFYAQFQQMVATALHTSIRFTNRIKGRTASIADHAAVADAIAARDVTVSRQAMQRIIGDVLGLIATRNTDEQQVSPAIACAPHPVHDQALGRPPGPAARKRGSLDDVR